MANKILFGAIFLLVVFAIGFVSSQDFEEGFNFDQSAALVDSNPSVELTIDKFYPKGMDYVFHCTADGFTPESYSWFFGDGEKLIDVKESSVFHRYGEGEYEVRCTATDGSIVVEDKMVISVIPQFNSNVFTLVTDDAYIDSINIHENFGDSQDLRVGFEFMGASTYISHLKFDLRPLDNRALRDIKSAELWVYKDNTPDTDVTHDVKRVLEDWDESEITWIDSPEVSPDLTDSQLTRDQIGWVRFDVTEDVNGFLEKSFDNHGWAIEHSAQGSGIDFETGYFSSEAENEFLRPRLVIEFEKLEKASIEIHEIFPADQVYVFECETDIEETNSTVWTWDFGDGTNKTKQGFRTYRFNPYGPLVMPNKDVYHVFPSGGEFEVTCTASDGERNVSSKRTVDVNYQPAAKLEATHVEGLKYNFYCDPRGYDITSHYAGTSWWIHNGTHTLLDHNPGPSSLSFDFTFPREGSYTVRCNPKTGDDRFLEVYWEEAHRYNPCRGTFGCMSQEVSIEIEV